MAGTTRGPVGGADDGGGPRVGIPAQALRGVPPWPLLPPLVLLLALPAAGRDPDSHPVDRVAVVVEGFSARERAPQLVTLWDLHVAAAVALLREAGPAGTERVVDADALRRAQAAAAEQLLVVREAVRLGRDAVAPEAIDEARDALAERAGGHDLLRAFLRDRSISLESVEAELRRELVAQRFTRTSVRLPAERDGESLRGLFEAGGHPFAGEEYGSAAERFAVWVRERDWEEGRRAWLVELRSRCRLAVFDVIPRETGGEAADGP